MSQIPEMQSFPAMSNGHLVLELTIKDRNGDVVDLTGGAGRFAMSRKPGGTTVIDSDASPPTASISIVSAVGGRVNVTMTDENTDALLGDYYYENKWTDLTGREAVTNRGYITFAENLT